MVKQSNVFHAEVISEYKFDKYLSKSREKKMKSEVSMMIESGFFFNTLSYNLNFSRLLLHSIYDRLKKHVHNK